MGSGSSIMERLIGNLSFYRSIIFVLILLCSALVYPHSGGLNSSGCHNVTATGGYHCHRGSSSSGRASLSNEEISNVGLILGSAAIITGVTLGIIANTKSNQWQKYNIYKDPAKLKFIIQPYADGHQFGLKWSAPVHD